MVAAAISFALPEQYVSRSRFIVEPSDESALLMANRVVQESAFDRHTLASLIRDYNLYPPVSSCILVTAVTCPKMRSSRK
jgi:hypothetical protein